MASSGRRASSTRGYLTPFARSVSTAKEVTSEPVPAVVGTATKRMSAPAPSFLPNSSMALAQSMGEPPPKATTAWGAELRQRPGPLGHQLQGRVGHHLVEHLHGAVPQAGAYPLQQAGLGQEGVGNHHHPPPGQPLQAARASDPKKIVGLS